jgi:beta-lactamase class A
MQRSRVRKPFYALLILLVVGAVFWLAPRTHTDTKADFTTKPAQKPSSSTTSKTDVALQSLIATWAKQQGFQSSVDVQEITGRSRSASYEPTSSMVTASTFKIYVAYAVLHAIEQGQYTLETTTSDGNSIQTDLDNMITNSDDASSRTLGFMIGWPAIDTLLKTKGINSTELNNYVGNSTTPQGDKYSTADDLASILDQLYAGTLLNKTDTQLLLGLMENQVWRERIPAGVPSTVTVADKPGWLLPGDGDAHIVENDAAIVYGPKSTYILTIMTDNNSSTQPLANLSEQIYNYLES